MYAIFDDASKFQTGRVLSQSESSAQIELESGKRIKVKSNHILLTFDKPKPDELLAQAQDISKNMELEIAWEFAPESDFGFIDLAREYFSAQASLPEQVAALFTLHNAPHYFRRAGKGRYKKASAELVQQALLAIEKKKKIQAQIDDWTKDLIENRCPESIQNQLYKILFKPDKNAPEYKAVVQATRAAQINPLELLRKAGAIESAYQFHWQRFLFDNFPKGTHFPSLTAPVVAHDLPLANGIEAFSIDDSSTTEIDDALSLQGLGQGLGRVILGIHIAAPALAIQPNSAIDDVARQRLSTVYMPSYKITMLPNEVVDQYTLIEGQACPAVSLYVALNEETFEIISTETKLERVFIKANLRHDQLDRLIHENWLNGAEPQTEEEKHQNSLLPASVKREELSFLYRLAQNLKARREVVRGKPETFNRPDYNFKLLFDEAIEIQASEKSKKPVPTGEEKIEITERPRGSVLDLIVAEAMILANSTWGKWLADLGVPAIYRSQAALSPGIKVRMGTKALAHAGIGVSCYAWSTSPLRRYTDLVNQWQIIACAEHGKTAALAAPFRPKDAQLFSIISAFEAAYSAYHNYQASIERFWTLKYIEQQGIQELVATVFKEGLNGAVFVRADSLPLVLPVTGLTGLPRGAKVRIKLGKIDEIALDVHGVILERLDVESINEEQNFVDEGEDDDEEIAGPLSIAVDLVSDEESQIEAEPESVAQIEPELKSNQLDLNTPKL